MSQEAATINHATDFSKKCLQCGLRHFADRKHCKRCKSDLSLPLKVAKNHEPVTSKSEVAGRPAFRFAWILAALVVGLLGVGFFYLRQGQQAIPEVVAPAVVVATPVTADAEQPAQSIIEQDSQSEAAARHIVTNLKRFQDATESGMEYGEFEKKLNSLKTDLNDTLPSLVRQNPSDLTFRQEVDAALRDYTAAGNWWKTTIANSTVFTEVDRNERTQRNFESARTHLANAEKTLVR